MEHIGVRAIRAVKSLYQSRLNYGFIDEMSMTNRKRTSPATTRS